MHWSDRVAALFALVACVALTAMLTDVHVRPLPPAPVSAPPPPASVEREASLGVRVLRGDAPVVDAEVRVYWQNQDRFYLAGSGRTDQNGAVVISELPRGVVWVLAEAPGLARSSTQLVLGDEPRQIEVSLPDATELDVTVTDDEDSRVIARATVLVTAADPLPYGALTGEDGTARFRRLGPSPWTVKASARGYESVTRSGVTGAVTLSLRRLGSLNVKVENPDGSAAPGASVVIAGSGLWPARRAETGNDGHARIVGLLAGSYDLRASLGQMVSDTLFGLSLERGGEVSVTLRLKAGRYVKAWVTAGEDEHADPVAGADVVLAEGGISSFPLRGRTGADGIVELGPIGAGPAMLTASAEGFVSRVGVAVPEPLDGPVRIALVAGATLEGLVVDSKDRPVDGASIEVIGIDLHGFPIADTPMSAALRSAHFEWALPGPAALIPAGELGIMSGPIPPIPPDNGALYAPDPNPIAASIPGWETMPNVEPWATNLDGRFVAKPVSPGRVRALVRHPAYVEGISDVVALAPGGSAEVKVVLLAGGSLEGKLVDGFGRPVSGARVDMTAVRGTLERTTITAHDGSFAFAAVPAEVIVSVARPEDSSRIVLRETVEVDEGETRRIELTLPSLRGELRVSVRDEDDRPVPAAEVRITSLAPDAPLRQTGFTDQDGRLNFEDARGLPLSIAVEAPGFARTLKSVEKSPETLTLVLKKGVIVEGRVTAVHGRRFLDGALVTIVAGGKRSTTRTNAEGNYRLRDVSPGNAQLTVTHPDYADVELSLQVERTGRADRPFEAPTVDLPDPGGVEGVVVDAKGEPVSGARVAVGIVPAYLPAGTLPPGTTVTDGQGRFTLRGVAPGRVVLEAYAPEVGRGRSKAIEVSAGRPTADVKISLLSGAGDDDPTVTGSVAVTLGERGGGQDLEVVIVLVAGGSEAERAGLLAGDVLYAVDGVDVTDMRDARMRLSGRPGSDLVLELGRGPQVVKLRISREHVRR